jgi:putative ABC transport system permease protein
MRRWRRIRRVHELPAAEDVERELASHIDLCAHELEESGWDAAAARREALRRFGDWHAHRREATEHAARAVRSRRRAGMLDDLRQDVRHGARGLLRTPGFTLVALLTLALGIGANTAAFSVIDGVLLRPLPYPQPHELVTLAERTEAGIINPVSYPNFLDWRERSQTLASMAAMLRPWPHTVLGAGDPLRASVHRVSGAYFDVLGVRPALGRGFVASDLVAGGAATAIVSHDFWASHLGRRRDFGAVPLVVDGESVTIIGVMPRSFRPPGGAELWVPIELQAAWGTRTAHNFEVIARLAPGVTPARARAELDAVAQEIRATEADASAAGVAVVPLRDEWVGDSSRALYILLGAAGLVLLIACANLASALLARGTRRGHEFAVRAALGARPRRIVQQLFTESLLLAAAGALLGVGFAYATVQALGFAGPAAVPRLEEIRVDLRVLLFTSAVTVVTALLFAAAPAFRAARAVPNDTLKQGRRGGEGPARAAVWSVLLGAEVAIAVVLLVGSLLLVRSFWQILNVDPGFVIGDAVVVPLSMGRDLPARDNDPVRYFDTVLERVRALPGVAGAAVTRELPLLVGFNTSGNFDIDGSPTGGFGGYRVVSDGYFALFGIPLLEGRVFDERDRAGAVEVMVVNRALADRFFPDGAIGRRLRTGGMDRSGDRWVTIVGVVENVQHLGLTVPPVPEYFLPYRQRPDRAGTMNLVVHPEPGRAGPLVPQLAATLRAIDADVPIAPARYRDRLGETLVERRFPILVLGAFALLALVLAAVGIYGIVSYVVAQRTREVGLRLALGGSPHAIAGRLFRRTMLIVLTGIAVGTAAALGGTRVLTGLLYEVDALDPFAFAAGIGVLAVVAAAAALVPVRRALRVDPMVVLKADG